jgi:hypothetical protein
VLVMVARVLETKQAMTDKASPGQIQPPWSASAAGPAGTGPWRTRRLRGRPPFLGQLSGLEQLDLWVAPLGDEAIPLVTRPSRLRVLSLWGPE